MTPDEALRRVRDPHEVLQLTDVELTEAAVTLAIEVERLRADVARVRAWCEDLQVPAVHGTYQGGYQAARGDVLRALDGG